MKWNKQWNGCLYYTNFSLWPFIKTTEWVMEFLIYWYIPENGMLAVLISSNSALSWLSNTCIWIYMYLILFFHSNIGYFKPYIALKGSKLTKQHIPDIPWDSFCRSQYHSLFTGSQPSLIDSKTYRPSSDTCKKLQKNQRQFTLWKEEVQLEKWVHTCRKI